MTNYEYYYPITYAPMKLKEFSSYSYRTNYAYIVAKCYLISETKRFFADGSSKMSYEVVFDWDQNGEKNILPEINVNQQCSNSCYVDYISNSIDHLKNYTRELNRELFNKEISRTSFNQSNNKSKIQEELLHMFDEAYNLEKSHLLDDCNNKRTL